MISIRVTAAGRSYVFPPGAAVRIGRAGDADVVLPAAVVSRRHAVLVPDGDAWRLVDDGSASGIWVAGHRVESVPVTGVVTAHLGDPQGDVEIILEPVAAPDAGSAATPAAAAVTGAPVTAPAAPRAGDAGAADPAGDAGAPTAPAPAGRAPVLVTRIGGQQRIFPVGARVRVGRDPTLELVSTNPLVSRQCHGLIVSDEHGATYTDMSRRGTFLDGKPLRRPLRITRSVVLRLGDPATGEELGITPPLSSAQLARNRGRKVLGMRARVAAGVGAAAAALVGLTVGLTVTVLGTAAPKSPQSTGLATASLRLAEAATVRLLIGSPGAFTGWGSGTVISPSGLILTNAHVAEPQAPGAAVAVGLPGSQLAPNPPFVTVEVTTGPASAVVPRYRARPVAVDGYLDLAVVQIYATDSGQPLSAASLHLPYLRLGDVAKVQLDQPVTVLGFPGVAGSDSITVTNGVISTFVPDPLGHVADPRFELETTARVAHGNSGGAAIDNSGRLIGVPSLAISGEGSDVSWRLRSVTEATPLIAAARAHAPYQSKVLVQLTGVERVTGAGVGSTAQDACAGATAVTPAPPAAAFGVDYASFPVGLDIAMLIDLPDGTTVVGQTGGLPQSTAGTSSGCFTYELTAASLGLAALPVGGYRLQLLAGPSLTPLSVPANLEVGSPPSASAAPAASPRQRPGTGTPGPG